MRRRRKNLVAVSSKTKSVGFRIGDIECDMLYRLMEYWKCSKSEAIRRCVVYTYVRFLLGSDVSEENLSRIVEHYIKFGKLLGV